MVDVCAATCRVIHALQGWYTQNLSDRGAYALAEAMKSSSCVLELVSAGSLRWWGCGGCVQEVMLFVLRHFV